GITGATNHGLTVGPGGATLQIDSAATTLGLLGSVTGSGALTLPGPGSVTVGSVALGSQPYDTTNLSAPLQINGGTLTALGNVNTSDGSPANIAAGAVLRTASTLNLFAYQDPQGHALDVVGAGTVQLAGTGSS